MSNRDRNEKELETVNASVSEKETEAKGRVKRDKKDPTPVKILKRFLRIM